MIIKEGTTTLEELSEGTLEAFWNDAWNEYGDKESTPTGEKWRVYKRRGDYSSDSFGRLGSMALTGTILLRQAGMPAGYVGWTDMGNWIKVQGVKTAKPFRKMGVATELIKKVTAKLNKTGAVVVGGMKLNAWKEAGWEEGDKPTVITTEDWEDMVDRGKPVLVYNALSSNVKGILRRNN